MATEATGQDTEEPARLTAVAYRYLPILEWLPAYKRSWYYEGRSFALDGVANTDAILGGAVADFACHSRHSIVFG